MARIQTPQTVQEVQAQFKVREAFTLELIETIQPVVVVASQKVASTGYPRRSFGFINAGAGGVGTNIECAIICPADVGIVVVIDRVVIQDLTGAQLQMRITDGVAMATVSSTPTARRYADGRITSSFPQATFAIANPLTAAPNGTPVGIWTAPADGVVQIDVDVILGGGDYLMMRQQTANAALQVNYFWTEFLLEDR